MEYNPEEELKVVPTLSSSKVIVNACDKSSAEVGGGIGGVEGARVGVPGVDGGGVD